MINRDIKQTRSMKTELKTRSEDENNLIIEGYFAVFNNETELWPGAFEEIAPGAFDETLSNDIRALTNHDTTLVLGRNKNGTLTLKTDSRGLWGSIKINPNDSDAMNLYQRVKRGDVDQCSFGFNVLQEDTDYREDGTIKWTLRKIDLHEVTCVTFPAYEDTGIAARKKDAEKIRSERFESRKKLLKERLKNGTETVKA
ncbi:HK97 family phage prohead protease [Tyzzerella sp. OttesenSCG-928-J15]|nr:HK97 family phage prohead protease [Tyzzerella sp. OttesenSCG-928-J15]